MTRLTIQERLAKQPDQQPADQLEPLVCTIPQTQRLLDCSRSSIYSLLRNGSLTAVELPGLKRKRVTFASIKRLAGG